MKVNGHCLDKLHTPGVCYTEEVRFSLHQDQSKSNALLLHVKGFSKLNLLMVRRWPVCERQYSQLPLIRLRLLSHYKINYLKSP